MNDGVEWLVLGLLILTVWLAIAIMANSAAWYYWRHPVARLLDEAAMQGVKIGIDPLMHRVRNMNAVELKEEIEVIRKERGVRYMTIIERRKYERKRIRRRTTEGR